MIYYDIIEFTEGIAVNNTNESKECHICLYWYFLNKGFTFQPNVCNGCHDLFLMSMNLSHIVILDINGFHFCCIFMRIRKSDSINLLQNIHLTKKCRAL